MDKIATNVPDQFASSQEDALSALDKFRSSTRQTGENASLLHLLTHGITSQALVLEELCQKIGQIKPDGGADLIAKWNDSLSICRRIQKSAYTHFQEEKGRIINETDLKLIYDVPADIADGKDSVPENCLKNLKQFSGENLENLDIATEDFLRNAFEIGLSQTLSHEGIKSLIIRRLHGFSLLILETYAGNLGISPSDLTLKQVIWCLEKHFRQESSPLKSLQKLQALPQINDKQFFRTCGIVARLSKLSVKNISNPDDAKLLEKARATEYFIKSLNSQDKQLVDKENSQRLSDNRELMNSIAIADFLTKHYASNYDTTPSTASTVLQVKQEEGDQEEAVFFVANNQKRGFKRNNFTRGRPNFFPQNQQPRQVPPDRHFRGNYRGGAGRSRGTQRGFRQNGGPRFGPNRPNFPPKYPQQPPWKNAPQNNGDHRYQRNNTPQQPNHRGYTPRIFVTPEQAGVGPTECLLCGGPHSFTSSLCPYKGVRPVPQRCYKHNPPKFAHPPNVCKGDLVVRKVDNEGSEDSFLLD